MAHTINKFNPPRPKGGRPPTYPWTQWLNGKTWELTLGIDFRGTLAHMQKLIRKTALQRGVAISAFQISSTKLVITARKRRQAG